MGLPRRKKTRLKMLMMIASSSIMVASLATATMAWYSVSVNISVSSSTITIRTPFQYYFYAYNENGFSIKTAAGAAVDTPASTDVFTKGNGYKTPTLDLDDIRNYTEVDALRYLGINSDQQTASNKQTDFVNALTEVSGLWPGYKMSFAIRATGLASDDAPQLKITALDPGEANSASLKRKTTATGNPYVYMAQAIQIYAKSASTFEKATTNPPKINSNDNPIGADTNWWSTSIALGEAAAQGGGDGKDDSVVGEWWYFWTIEFSNDTSTFYSLKSSTETNGVTTETYAKDPDGDSNAYQGLEFKITTMTLQND